MAPSLSVVPTGRPSDEQELFAAANAVFGVLEMIVETPCSHDTQQNVLVATHAAHGRLAELGLTRTDLMRSQAWGGQPRCVETPELPPRAGRVIRLPAR
jgi:hypothetical protein